MGSHVEVHFLLQVDTQLSVCADDDIGAHPLSLRDVAIGIWNGVISRIVHHVLPGERHRRPGELLKAGGLGKREVAPKHKSNNAEQASHDPDRIIYR